MTGARGIGVHTQANKLAEIYGLKVIDYQQLVKKRIMAILKADHKLPNNVVPGSSKVGLSDHEVDEIKSGRPFPSWKFIPWIIDELGYPLMKRPPPPPPEEGEEKPEEPELTEEEKAKLEKEKKKKEAEDAKKAKEEEEARKAKEERRRKREEKREAGLAVEESEVEEEKVEDLSIDNLVLKVNQDGTSKKISGFILIGFP